MKNDSNANVGKFIVPFDERNKVLNIQSVHFQEFSGVTFYECKYTHGKSTRSFNVAGEMENYAIFDTLQEGQKVSNMTMPQLIIEYIQSNKAIERLCRKQVDLKAEIERLKESLPQAIESDRTT